MTRAVDPQRRCLPVAEWPAADKAAWDLALQPADLLDPSIGYARRWALGTLLMIESGYGRFLGWLILSGQLDPDASPGARATRERVGAYLAMLRELGLADYTVAGRLQQLANALKAMEPLGDWAWIQRASDRIHARAIPVRDQTIRMQPVEDVIALGFDLIDAAENSRFRTDRERATLYRDGVMLCLLAQRPFRAANFSALAVGHQLLRHGDIWWLSFAPEETKGDRAIECAWPENLVDALNRYLAVYRPILMKSATATRRPAEGLWVSRQGTTMTVDAVAFQIRDRTKTEFGKPINPNNFRNIVATTIATANPEGATDIPGVLGHAGMKMSDKFYNKAKQVSAGETYQATIAGLRKDSRRGRRRPTKGAKRPAKPRRRPAKPAS